jgi:hypothetical protein
MKPRESEPSQARTFSHVTSTAVPSFQPPSTGSPFSPISELMLWSVPRNGNISAGPAPEAVRTRGPGDCTKKRPRHNSASSCNF